MTDDGRRPAILAIDTATTQVVIATGSPVGVADGISTWAAGHRHGETLLPSIGRFLGEQNLRRSRLVGIVVGTGPGAFTGLRVGIATAKGLAHGLAIPLVGVSTAEALIAAAASADRAADAADAAGAVDETAASEGARIVLLLPAGPFDRIIARPGEPPRLLPGGTDPELRAGERLMAIDLPDRAPAEALAAGELARAGLGAALLAAGAAALRTGRNELGTLVPEYVTLPRGARPAEGTVAWSRDPR